MATTYHFKNNGNAFVYILGYTTRTIADIKGETLNILAVVPCDGKEYTITISNSYTYYIPFILYNYSNTRTTGKGDMFYWDTSTDGTFPTIESDYTAGYNGNCNCRFKYNNAYVGNGALHYITFRTPTSSTTSATYIMQNTERWVTFVTNAVYPQTSDDFGISDVVIGGDATITINTPTASNSTVTFEPSEPTFTDTFNVVCTPNDGYGYNPNNVPYINKTVGDTTTKIIGTLNDDGSYNISTTFDTESDTTIDIVSNAVSKSQELILYNIGNAFVYLLGTNSTTLSDIENNNGNIITCIPSDSDKHVINIDYTKYQYIIPFILRKYAFDDEGIEGIRTNLFDWIEEQYFAPSDNDVDLSANSYLMGYRSKLTYNDKSITVDGKFIDSLGATQNETNDNGTIITSKFSTNGVYNTLISISDTASNYVKFNSNCPTKQTYDDLGIINYINVEEGTIENCTVTWTPTKPSFADELVFICTPNDGYHFSVTPYITLDYEIKYYDTSSSEWVTETKHDVIDGVDNGDGSYTIKTTFNEYTYYTVTVSAYAIVDESGATGYLYTLFKVSEKNMQAIADTRYVLVTLSSGDTETIDLGQFINSLKKFYCDVPTNTKTQSILLGTYKIDTQAPTITDEIFDINCGSITVEEINKNASDYNITVNCYLPFIGLVSIDGDRVMGRTINLVYSISAVNGTCVAKFICDDCIIATFEGSIAIDLPYITYGDEGSYNTQIVNNANILYGYTPYIYLNYYPNYNPNGSTLMNDDKYARVGDLTGFNVLTDIDYVGLDIPSDEIDMIEQIMAQGVYV